MQFDFLEISKKLRWQPYHKTTHGFSLRQDRINEITYSLTLLKNIGAITQFDVININEVNCIFKPYIKEKLNLDNLIEKSRYFPLEGWPQEIGEEFLRKKIFYFEIPYYNEILKDSIKLSYKDTAIAFRDTAFYEWEDAYKKMKNGLIDVTDVFQNNFTFLIDAGSVVLDAEEKILDFQNERVIVFAGFSKSDSSKRPRNKKRMRENRKNHFSDWSDKETDTGHYVAHSIWQTGNASEVDLEFNLFPQKRDLNQGHSESGKLFRKMETYCAKNPNTFLFIRPIYGDSSIRPFLIEYCILLPDLTLWIEKFENV